MITPEIAAFIKEHRLTRSSAIIAKEMKISKSAVLDYLKNNNLQLTKKQISKKKAATLKGRTSFTADQDEFIKDNYLKLPVRTMAKLINRSTTGINGRMSALNLVVPTTIIEERKKQSQFYKGIVAHNKGKKISEWMSEENIKKSIKNRFKKGHLPHNTAFNGAITIRRDAKTGILYKYIRVDLGEWELYHRHFWEQKNGPIPEGCVIAFKDGNSLNCEDINNLQLLTMAENLKRNWHVYPQELKRAIKLTNKIKKEL